MFKQEYVYYMQGRSYGGGGGLGARTPPPLHKKKIMHSI